MYIIRFIIKMVNSQSRNGLRTPAGIDGIPGTGDILNVHEIWGICYLCENILKSGILSGPFNCNHGIQDFPSNIGIASHQNV